MQQTGCDKVLCAQELSPLVTALKFASPAIETDDVPSFEELINSISKPVPYDKTFEEAINDPVVVLHSSGSTGQGPSS